VPTERSAVTPGIDRRVEVLHVEEQASTTGRAKSAQFP
jgi:hypothetical protein